jgi:hypothetical protein
LECIQTTSTPAQVELDQPGTDDEITITCDAENADTYKVDVYFNNILQQTLQNPISSSSTQATFTFDPDQEGTYTFACWAMSDNGDAEDCPSDTTTVTDPVDPWVC